MMVTGEVLWPMDMRLFIDYCHDMILSEGCSIDDRDRGSVVANNVSTLISYYHDMIFSAGCSIDDRDSGSGSVMANEYENVYQLLSRRISFGGLFD